MSGSQNVASDQYSRADVGTRGLACPFAKSDPERYMNVEACKTIEGFKEPRFLFEHMWRKHTRFYRCGYCIHKWSTSLSRKDVKQKKEQHWKSCEDKLRGAQLPEEPDEGRIELLNGRQQRQFEKIRSMKDVGTKLEALYGACGKPLPETYHATTVFPAVPPQMTYELETRNTSYHNQQSIGHGEGFLEGFGRVDPGAPSQHRRPPTSSNVSRNTAALKARNNAAVSGADRPRDADSGYVSMPSNSGDTIGDSSGVRPPFDPMMEWSASYTRSDGGSATYFTVSSSGYVANDNHFASDYEHGRHSYLQGDGDSDLAFYDSASLSRDASLLGLIPPNSGPDNVGEDGRSWSLYPDSE